MLLFSVLKVVYIFSQLTEEGTVDRGGHMSKQIHIRLDDKLYGEITFYAENAGLTVQDVSIEAYRNLINRRRSSKQPDDATFSFIDLFAGIGGMRLAYESAGGKCVYSSEWNKWSQKTYFANFGEQPEGDITKVDENTIPEHDILLAGFPCQPFSIAGVSKKNSMGKATGFEDKTQGTLFFDVCRILRAKRPKAFMLENVKNLKSHDHGNTFRVIMDSLNELDYQVFYQIIDGQSYVPQHRERIIIVGFDRRRYGPLIDFEFNLTPRTPKPVLRDILDKEVDDKYTLSDKLWSYLRDYAAKHKAAGNGFGYGLADPDGITRTLSARYYKDGSEILIPQQGKNPRRLTPRECARLQGFPDSFIIPVSDTQAYRQFGNSVVVPLMRDVAGLVVSKMKDLDEITANQRCIEGRRAVG